MLTNVLQPPTSIADLILNGPSGTPADNGARVVEFPYIYVYDGNSLTNGTSPTGLYVPITADADFYLRRVFGVPTVASTIQYRQAYGKRYMSDPEKFSASVAVPREIKFAADSRITFDLGTVLKLAPSSVPCAYIGWQGVKRMMLAATPYDTPYAFKRLPITHNFSLTLDWAYNATVPTRRQSLLIQNYDFELHCIRIINTTTNEPENGVYSHAILLYDAFMNRTSNLPVINEWINEALCGSLANIDNSLSSGVFPVPPLIYPRNSMIQFDIQSLLPSGSKSLQIQFVGFQRYPLEG